MNNRNLHDSMRKVQAFTSMPATAAKLLPPLDGPHSPPSEVENIVKYDPGLTANILKLTNSAMLGLMTGFGKAEVRIDIEPIGLVVDRLGLKANHLEAIAQQTRRELEKLSDLWDMA